MHEKATNLQRMIDCGVIAIVRTQSADTARAIARAAITGGAGGIEITLTTPDGLEIIAELSREFGQRCIIGAGTVLNATTCTAALRAGAKFIVSPSYDPQTLQLALKSGAISIPGAFTPAEILTVSRAGADLIKVFPSTSVGPAYFRDLLRPLPHLKLIATGGVTMNDAAEWIQSGSILVGVGGDLIPEGAIERGDWDAVSARTAAFVETVRLARVR
ncbi:MAG TPA: bifunctional 4-hydroxy-2-oxoglutarate aldolase/2-dehydro-3-deoxy-phosphogluconate aldolase [Tepidisphaeraceae bacterium]|nr:bifunctional 4-hydroxy-2-oxoglutarate aldolase/2-dehydro-3-deoxy-phosphogluconate aldolase [Tepidisphaeraceae bacterium]